MKNKSGSQFPHSGTKKSMVHSSRLNICFLICVFFLLSAVVFASENTWSGVDKAVVEKHAQKYGVEPKEPLINTDKGDLLLFIFTLAGVAGGFVIGYNFRKIFKEKKHGPVS